MTDNVFLENYNEIVRRMMRLPINEANIGDIFHILETTTPKERIDFIRSRVNGVGRGGFGSIRPQTLTQEELDVKKKQIESSYSSEYIFRSIFPKEINNIVNEFIRAIDFLILLQPFVNDQIKVELERNKIITRLFQVGVQQKIIEYVENDSILQKHETNLINIYSKFDDFFKILIIYPDLYRTLFNVFINFKKNLI